MRINKNLCEYFSKYIVYSEYRLRMQSKYYQLKVNDIQTKQGFDIFESNRRVSQSSFYLVSVGNFFVRYLHSAVGQGWTM